MKTKHRILAGGLALCAAGSLVAQNAVLNGDFSSNGAAFTTFPGYAGGGSPPNPLVDNWTHNATGNHGVNGVGISNPFGPADRSAATYYGLFYLPRGILCHWQLPLSRSNNGNATRLPKLDRRGWVVRHKYGFNGHLLR